MFEAINQRLCDEQSREIFEARMLYSVTGDYGYIRKIVEMTKPAGMLRKCSRIYPEKTYVIWGADFLGSVLIKSFPDIKWEAFIDNNPKCNQIEGIPVYGREVFLEKYKDAIVVIASIGHYAEIQNQILSYGVPDAYIINLGRLVEQMLKEQYFDVPLLYHSENEVFVDAGFFDGATSKNFIEWSGGKYKQIIGFEPDLISYERYINSNTLNSKLLLLNACVWSKETMLGFAQTGKSSATIDRRSSGNVQAKSIDGIQTEFPISFIKMDVEGAEGDAILGAQKTLEKYKPKMAICVYHNREDIWKIPELILKINSEYRFVLRHYSLRDAETVLYAI